MLFSVCILPSCSLTVFSHEKYFVTFFMEIVENSSIFSLPWILLLIVQKHSFELYNFFTIPYKILGYCQIWENQWLNTFLSLFLLLHIIPLVPGAKGSVRVSGCPLALLLHVLMVRGVGPMSKGSISGSHFCTRWLATS